MGAGLCLLMLCGKPFGKRPDLDVNGGVIQLVMCWRHIDVDLKKDVTLRYGYNSTGSR